MGVVIDLDVLDAARASVRDPDGSQRWRRLAALEFPVFECLLLEELVVSHAVAPDEVVVCVRARAADHGVPVSAALERFGALLDWTVRGMPREREVSAGPTAEIPFSVARLNDARSAVSGAASIWDDAALSAELRLFDWLLARVSILGEWRGPRAVAGMVRQLAWDHECSQIEAFARLEETLEWTLARFAEDARLS